MPKLFTVALQKVTNSTCGRIENRIYVLSGISHSLEKQKLVEENIRIFDLKVSMKKMWGMEAEIQDVLDKNPHKLH